MQSSAVKAYLAGFVALSLAAPARAAPSIVVDVASGQVLEQEQATQAWYPASTTKLMTVYVALNAVKQGRISLDTPIVISSRATQMAPSKMGFRAGQEVTLHNALIMLMVKSANDIAVAVAEGVSGSVEAFADEMNEASASLGMKESHWVNPNGLPDERQVTSARDLALVARALLTQFPDSANLYNIGSMQLGRKLIRTHNGMLGRYPGADGMKTGFTCPAGFNLVASATRGDTKLVAVVLGAPSANARTAKAAALLDRAFQGATAQGAASSLQSVGVGAAPDLRDTVCRHRGKSTQEFLAEVEDMTIPLDATGAQRINVKQLAQLPAPAFQPVPVYVGRAPGYEGPVARARPAGAPVGSGEATAYAAEKPAVGSEPAPVLHPAVDAQPMRAAHKTAPAELRRAVTAKAHAPTKTASLEGKKPHAAAKGEKFVKVVKVVKKPTPPASHAGKPAQTGKHAKAGKRHPAAEANGDR
ncbi:MAG TPA: serine hydrolase [Methylocystis sp.]|nr:serine hydrolase [Methylocystis sp.]